MKIISVLLILIGLYLMINENSEQEKPQKRKIQYHEKNKHEKLERLVEIVDPNWDVKHPKKN